MESIWNQYGIGIEVRICGIGTKFVGNRYKVDTKLVQNWYEIGTKLVQTWYQIGTNLVQNWYGLVDLNFR